MSLLDLLNTLETGMKISILEKVDNVYTETITFFSGGEDRLNNEVLQKSVVQISISSKSYIKISVQ